MIRNSKSIAALFFLFLCFFSTTTYLKKIIFDKDIYYGLASIFNSKNVSCEPKSDSLIGFNKANNLKTLIIIIDAYPNNVIYKDITGNNSELHHYLKSTSKDNINTYTVLKGTQISLPFLLGKIAPNNDCRYPFMRGAFKPKLLINHELIQSNEGLCPKAYNYNSHNRFIKYSTRFKSKINKKHGLRIKKLLNNCSISNTKIIDNIIKELEKKSKNNEKTRINIAHEFQFHRNARENITNLRLPSYDAKYLEGLKYLIEKLKKSNSINELIIMNDHGPRTKIYGDIDAEFKSGSLLDNNFHGVFAYRIPINKKLEGNKKRMNLNKLIPLSKERYDLKNKNQIIRLDKFRYQNED